MKRRVVVTGMGVVTPLGCAVEDLWKEILAGKSGIRSISIFDPSEYKVRIGGGVHDWDPTKIVAEKDVKRIDRFTQFALKAAEEAVQGSGLDFENENPSRTGVILGTGIGGLAEIEKQMAKLIKQGPGRVSALTIPKLILNAAGGNISIKYGLRGPNYTVVTACASATNAMGDALRNIQNGDSDIMITGGTEAAMTQISVAGFANMRALSTRNDDPERACRPFDVDRDGFVISEGAGVIVFEELERARERGADILCEVLGFGTSCDAGHITQPDPKGAGAADAMAIALKDAGLNPEDIDYVNAHGTSTPLGDIAETTAVKRVFGEHAYKLSISSTKSQLGHSLGASGGIEAILAIKAMQQGVIPPTINLDNPDPDCDLDYTPHVPREKNVKVIMSNSFGFGGHNASVVMGMLS